MKKTASEIANNVAVKIILGRKLGLEKLGMRAGISRAIKQLDKIPGLRGFSNWHRASTRDASRRFTSNPTGDRSRDTLGLVSDFLESSGKVPSETLKKRIQPFARGRGQIAKSIGDDLSPITTLDKRQAISGLHGPRTGEVLIPSAASAKETALIRPEANPSVFFRGNPRPTQGATYMSRHPDVASHYTLKHPDMPIGGGAQQALQEKGINFTPPSSRLQAYSGKNLNTGLGEVPGGTFQKARSLQVTSEKAKKSAREALSNHVGPVSGEGRSVQDARHSMKFNPTYEKLVRSNVKPKLLGEYEARQSRTPQGAPAFAISRIKGQAPEKVFRESIGKTSPLFSDIR